MIVSYSTQKYNSWREEFFPAPLLANRLRKLPGGRTACVSCRVLGTVANLPPGSLRSRFAKSRPYPPELTGLLAISQAWLTASSKVIFNSSRCMALPGLVL